MFGQLLEEVKERKGAYSEAHKEAEGPHRVYTPCLGNHLILSSCNICWRHKITAFNFKAFVNTGAVNTHKLSLYCYTLKILTCCNMFLIFVSLLLWKIHIIFVNNTTVCCVRPLTRADSRHTRRCWWWNSCPSGSGWWVHSPGRACTSAGSGLLWSDCSGRARTGHPLHNQSHIPGGINRRNTPSKGWGWWFGEMCSWWKEGLNVDYRGSGIKEWSWLAGSEENNGLPLLRVHLTLAIISLTLSVWMSGLPLQDLERPGIWIIKALGDTHCCIIASLLLRFCMTPSPSRLSECPVDWEASKQRKRLRKGARIMERYMEKIRWILFLCSTIESALKKHSFLLLCDWSNAEPHFEGVFTWTKQKINI